MVVDNGIDEVARLGCIPNIALMKACAAPLRLGNREWRVPSADRNFTTCCQQRFSDRASEAASAARDDRDFAG